MDSGREEVEKALISVVTKVSILVLMDSGREV